MAGDSGKERTEAAGAAIDQAAQPTEGEKRQAERLAALTGKLMDLTQYFSHAEIVSAMLSGDIGNNFEEALGGFGFIDATMFDDDYGENEVDETLGHALACLRRGAKDDARHHLYTHIREPFRDLFHPDSGI